MKGNAPKPSSTIAGLSDKPGHLIRRAHQVTATIFEACAGRYRITPAQHAIMTALFKQSGIDQATLATLVAMDKVTVGQVVKRLEARGLVARIDSAADRRSWNLSLSTQGSRLLRSMQSAIRRSQSELLAPLSPVQRKQFFAIMRRLVGLTAPHKRRQQ